MQDNYEKVFSRLARNAILNAASEFVANAYWQDRKEVGDTMKRKLTKQMEEVFANTTGFMLLKIDLPNNFEYAIVRKMVTNQEILTYNMNRKVKIIN